MPRSLQALLDHEDVTAPRQERSQRTLERILAALGELLNEKSFEQISMAELAARAECAVTSIYTRFKDKWSMIAALHQVFRQEAIGQIDSFLAPERWRERPADEIIDAAVAALVASYHRHRHLLRAVLLTDDAKVYGAAASIADHIAERLVQVLPAQRGADEETWSRRVHFGVRVVTARLQQMVLLDAVQGGSAVPNRSELTRELGHMLAAYLGGTRPRAERRKRRTRKP